MTSSRPRVATISERKWTPDARCLVEMLMAARLNIRRHHGSADTTGHLCGQVGDGVTPPQATERGVDEGHDGVELRPRDRAEHQDDGEQPRRRGRGVLKQLQPAVPR
jgi:hypothetical protein